MIMYTWKQFGNDFRNGDDAVFWDSNRPRDENGFKLRPWLQGDKWSFRDVNKKTWFSQIVLKWWSDIQSTPNNQPVIQEIPVIKAKWERADRNNIAWYPYVIEDSRWKAWAFSNEIWNNPQYKLVEWDFEYEYQWFNPNTQAPAIFKKKHTTCLEIVEDGLYNVFCQWTFYFNYAWTYDSSNGYLNKEWIGLMECANDTDSRFLTWPKHCARAVWNMDVIDVNTILFLTKWLKLLPYAALQQPNWLNGVYFVMSVTKLW